MTQSDLSDVRCGTSRIFFHCPKYLAHSLIDSKWATRQNQRYQSLNQINRIYRWFWEWLTSIKLKNVPDILETMENIRTFPHLTSDRSALSHTVYLGLKGLPRRRNLWPSHIQSGVAFSKIFSLHGIKPPLLPFLFSIFRYSFPYYLDMPMQSRLALSATSESHELVPFNPHFNPYMTPHPWRLHSLPWVLSVTSPRCLRNSRHYSLDFHLASGIWRVLKIV